jgi:hypothetical protein
MGEQKREVDGLGEAENLLFFNRFDAACRAQISQHLQKEPVLRSKSSVVHIGRKLYQLFASKLLNLALNFCLICV